jgi:hypothetical protein
MPTPVAHSPQDSTAFPTLFRVAKLEQNTPQRSGQTVAHFSDIHGKGQYHIATSADNELKPGDLAKIEVSVGGTDADAIHFQAAGTVPELHYPVSAQNPQIRTTMRMPNLEDGVAPYLNLNSGKIGGDGITSQLTDSKLNLRITMLFDLATL